jgi:hypothetical protein
MNWADAWSAYRRPKTVTGGKVAVVVLFILFWGAIALAFHQ